MRATSQHHILEYHHHHHHTAQLLCPLPALSKTGRLNGRFDAHSQIDAMDLTEDQTTRSKTPQHKHSRDNEDAVTPTGNSTRAASHETTEEADPEKSRAIPWLREDCLAFYQNELLRGKTPKSTTPIPVKDRVRLLRLAINRAMGVKKRFPQAQFLEFGVHEGKDLVRMASFLRSIEEKQQSKPTTTTIFHGFDSFQGLPEDWINGQLDGTEPFHKKGAFDTGGESPDIESLVGHQLKLGDHGRNNNNSNYRRQFQADNLAFHKGWFHESLPPFLDEHQGTPVAFVHADADLYTSTLTFLTLLCERSLLCKGSVIVFDEFWNYPHWQDGEFKAWQEIVETFGLEYEYFGYHAPHPTAKKFKQYGYQSVGLVITSDMKKKKRK